jgi:ATP dependent DNA ligase domain
MNGNSDRRPVTSNTRGKVVVRLHGNRASGRYALYRMHGDDWRVHRTDPPADPSREPLPERIGPMLARLGGLPADEDAYRFEIKWDGIRAIGYWEPGRWRLESRNLRDITATWPEVRAIGRQLASRSAVLDGEIVALDEQGRPSFERLQPRMHLTGDAAIRRRAGDVPRRLRGLRPAVARRALAHGRAVPRRFDDPRQARPRAQSRASRSPRRVAAPLARGRLRPA